MATTDAPHPPPLPTTAHPGWSALGPDITELILSHLPLRSIVIASAVCKQWRSAVTHPSFSSLAALSRPPKPWFFLYGLNNVFTKNNQAFAFDPDSSTWSRLPTSDDDVSGSAGFLFSADHSLRFSPLLLRRPLWRQTPPLRVSRSNPLIGVIGPPGRPSSFVVVGGVKYIGGLVDIEDGLAVEVYDVGSDSWDLCPPMPPEFRSHRLSSAVIGHRVYVCGIHTCHVSHFDVAMRRWSAVRALRPVGVQLSFLVACADRLLLAGLCGTTKGPLFKLWSVCDDSGECVEIGAMPQEMLMGMFDSEGEEEFASLRCVGLEGMVYVFNEEQHRAYPACLCEVAVGGGCVWRKVPELPGPVNRFHRVVSFCSCVSPASVLG
ncbi:F-box/kelch-repeat protein [Acorus gramineus]|uniref:F-box/kelch-repeat protein n=1 Tax=Acorus gramineus TaxID=55184 RepID=A0AAV9AQA6_ACOGR|nr:F-box/kelch-repeat protein [Acorus gramineus]